MFHPTLFRPKSSSWPTSGATCAASAERPDNGGSRDRREERQMTEQVSADGVTRELAMAALRRRIHGSEQEWRKAKMATLRARVRHVPEAQIDRAFAKMWTARTRAAKLSALVASATVVDKDSRGRPVRLRTRPGCATCHDAACPGCVITYGSSVPLPPRRLRLNRVEALR